MGTTARSVADEAPPTTIAVPEMDVVPMPRHAPSSDRGRDGGEKVHASRISAKSH